MIADQPDERVGELRAAAAGHRHAALLDGDGDHLRHEPRRRRVGAEARVQDPRREQAVRALRRERRLEPVAARLQQLAGERGKARAAQPAQRLRAEAEPGGGPELRAEDPEGEVGVREEAREHARPLRAELACVPLGVAEEERGLAVREGGRRGQVRVEVLEPARRELAAELGVRGAADPERMPGAEDVVDEARLGDLRRVDRTAEPVVALEHADAPAAASEQRAARQRIDTAADDHRVVLSHLRAPGTRRP